ncbi:hypothetical protein TVAG_378150 [Trichomonas vaginalis G3]|uniref:Bap-like n=1 Tax=Trichomonas vaginalis (strain ATCC PRA-98 / G3) TaxID=412133 RepID=A2DB06_TRIV3|nr:hypothetical protein TVAG_378150 [Trichomonas vaginalis G3]|eukprot:XP_001583322.1 hypothetical protein [Trichomonas vaginalis G3]
MENLIHLSRYYDPGSMLQMQLQFFDFNPEENYPARFVLIDYNNDIEVFSKDLNINVSCNDHYISDIIDVSVELPSYIGSYMGKIILELERMKYTFSVGLIPIKLRPKLLNIEPIKDEYAHGERIEIKALCTNQGNFYTKLSYYFDGDETNPRDISAKSYNRNEYWTNNTIEIPNDFKDGYYSVTIFVRDEFSSSLEREEMRFYLNNKHTPEIICSFDVNNMELYQKINAEITVADRDIGDHLEIYRIIDNDVSKQEKIKEFDVGNQEMKFTYVINQPKVEGTHNITFLVKDQTGLIAKSIRNYYVYKVPSPYITSSLSSSYKGGEIETISCFVKDFIPGQKVQVYYKFNNDILIHNASNELTVRDDYRTDKITFNVQMPTKYGQYHLDIWATDSGPTGKYSYYQSLRVIVNKPPIIQEFNNIRDLYYRKSFIVAEGTVFDEDSVYFGYKFNNENEYTRTSYYLKCSDQNTTFRYEVPIPDSLNPGPNTLHIVFWDNYYGKISESKSQEFTYDQRSAPELYVSVDSSTVYFHEKINFHISVKDIDPNDIVHVMMKVNDKEEVEIYSGNNQGQTYNFDHQIRPPLVQGTSYFIFRTYDSEGAEGIKKTQRINIISNPKVVLTSNFDQPFYAPNSSINKTHCIHILFS